jgi:hypothetical protein
MGKEKPVTKALILFTTGLDNRPPGADKVTGPISSECATCFGKSAACGTQCAIECGFGSYIASEACIECNTTKCKEIPGGIYDCTGLKPDQLPPNPRN